MARQVLPIAGAIIGGIYGGPSGAQAGYAIGSLVGNEVDPLVNKGPRIGDAAVQTSAEGAFRPVIFGTGAVMGNVIERGNRQIHKKRTRDGKGGPVNEEGRVYWTFAIRICEGPIVAVTRIWEDEKLVYDARPESTIEEETTDFAQRCRIYLGDEEQLPDPSIEAYRGEGEAPAYRGTAYIVFPDYDLTDRRESIPNYRFEVSTAGFFYEAGTEIAAQVTVPGYYQAVSIYRNGDGVGACYAADELASGGTFYQRDYDETLSSYVDRPTVWLDGGGGDSRLYLRATSAQPVAISADNNFGLCKLVVDGAVVGTYQPSDTENDGWWYNENGHSPEFGGLVWPMQDAFSNFYLGVRHTGSISQPYTRTLLRFLQGGTSPIPEEASILDIGGDAPPHFWMHVDREGNVWILGTDGVLTKYDWTLLGGALATYAVPFTQLNLRGFGVDRNTICLVYGDDGVDPGNTGVAKFVRLSDWSVYSEVHAAGMYGNVNTKVIFTGTSCYIQCQNWIGRVPYGPSADGGTAILADIVDALHVRASTALGDTSPLTDVVDGVVFAGDYTCADAIKSLAPVYFFDSPEYDDGSGYAIRYRKRGGEVVRVITIDDMVDEPDETIRADALERPRRLHMSYQSPTVGYAAAKASPSRNSPDVLVVGEVSTQVPIAFGDETEAWQRADVMLRQIWAEVGGEESLTLSDEHIDLIASDPIAISLRGQVRRARLTQVSIEPGKLSVKCLPDRQSAYTSNLTGMPLPAPTPPPPSMVGPPVAEILDIPALTDTNDRLLYYGAITGQTEAWNGGVIQRTTDGGLNWETAVSARINTIMGTLTADLGAASPHFTDTTNRVGVRLYGDDELVSLTVEQFLSEGGSFAIEFGDGSWEILQYRDADQDPAGVWWLSYLARGRLNTGGQGHLAGARVVFLDGVYSVDAVTAWINTTLEHRAVSNGTSPDAATPQFDLYTARSQREFPVAHLFLARATDTINARTVPRHRFGTEVTPVRSQHWIAFRWTATDGTNTITRDTVDQNTVFDVAGWSSPVTISVSQVNRFTGAGPQVSEHIA